MGVVKQDRTLTTVLAGAWPDPEGRRWAVAHQGTCTFVAWEDFETRIVYRLGLGSRAEPIGELPAELVWATLPQP